MILAPQGRDAWVAQGLLADAHVKSKAVAGLSALIQELQSGAAAVLLAEEAVAHQTSPTCDGGLRSSPLGLIWLSSF